MRRFDLPVPPFFDPGRVSDVRRIPYQDRAAEAEEWSMMHAIEPAGSDRFKICLVVVDVQNTFCIPGFELYVGGRSGTGAVDDNRRLCDFIYRNLGIITQICPTMDTHQGMQIFHPIYLINDKGEHPAPFTLISVEDVERGVWKFNSALCYSFGITADYGQKHLVHYARRLRAGGKYELTVWPYHGMLGGIGHALVAAIEEAVFFHSVVRKSRADFHVKGDRPFTEHYSVLGPEVTEDHEGKLIGSRSDKFFRKLLDFDAVLIAGQAKSHCVAWTIDDLLADIRAANETLVEKVYLLEDCSSPVVVPGVIDYTDKAEEAFMRFSDAGMHVVKSIDQIENWPGIRP